MCDKTVNAEHGQAKAAAVDFNWKNSQARLGSGPVTFSAALAALKNGGMITREHALGLEHVYLQHGEAMFSDRDNGSPIEGVPVSLFRSEKYLIGIRMPMLCKFDNKSNSTQPGWFPSVADILAEDWIIL
jgi:hypothetical protein